MQAVTKYVSEIGMALACDKRPDVFTRAANGEPTELSQTFDVEDYLSLNDRDIIFINALVLDEFLDRFWKEIQEQDLRIVLVTYQHARTVPVSTCAYRKWAYKSLLESPSLIHWFTNNCDLPEHPKLTPVPIGLNYITLAVRDRNVWMEPPATVSEQEAVLSSIISEMPAFSDRKAKCYSTFHLLLHQNAFKDEENERLRAIKMIPEDLMFYEPGRVMRRKSWINQAAYKFVISPRGTGLDCYRTWEALILGCMPILKKSVLDPLFDGLPVILVDDWSDITAELLAEKAEQYESTKWSWEKLTTQYWIDLFHGCANT
jgi:hypothetical protein